MMRTCPEIAGILGCHKNLLHYHLQKPDAPLPTQYVKNRRIIKKWDVEEVKKFWAER